MGNVGASLTKKVGPLPVWAWGAITAVVLFGAYYIIKKRQGSSASNTSTTATDTSGSGTGNGSGDYPYPIPGGGGGDSGGGGNGAPPTPQTPPTVVVGTQPVVPPDVAPPTTTPVSPVAPSPTSPVAPSQATAPIVNANSSVPAAVQLQKTVAKPNAAGVYPSTVAAAHPSAVKITANKTGGSANKTQGVFAVH